MEDEEEDGVELIDAEVVWSTTVGDVVVADVVVVVSVAALRDLIAWEHPLRTNPAKITVNKTEFFIGGLSCRITDRARLVRFGN